MERKLAKLSKTTFTYRSSSYLFYAACSHRLHHLFSDRQATPEKTVGKNKNFGVVKQEGQA
jgi:hypothetical protein